MYSYASTHLLRATHTAKSELVHMKQPVSDFVEEQWNTEFLWSQLLSDQLLPDQSRSCSWFVPSWSFCVLLHSSLTWTNKHSSLGMGIENRFLFRTGSQWTDSLESLAKFFNDSANGSLCRCTCANLLIQTAANMLAFWITSDWGEWDWWWNNSSWDALLSFLSNTTVLVFRSSVSLGASG